MAGRNTRLPDKGKAVRHFCYECENSYDWHEKDYKGEFFLCRCPFHKWSRFLYRDGCTDNFKPRKQ